MKTYKIHKTKKPNENYATMIILLTETGAELAEYRLTVGEENKEIQAMRRSLNKYLDTPGAIISNYPF